MTNVQVFAVYRLTAQNSTTYVIQGYIPEHLILQ